MILTEAVDQTTGEIFEIGTPGLGLPGQHTNVSLALPEGIAFGEWAAIGETLAAVEHSIGWWLGDWWAYGEGRYGERKKLVERLQAESRSFPNYKACCDAGWVARRIKSSDRSELVPFTVHRAIASVENADERREILEIAEREQWGVREAKAEVARRKNARAVGAELPGADTCTTDDLHKLVQLGAKFGTVYADPPWLYDNQGTRAATGNHYGGMTVDELCAMPIRELAADDSHLHLWTTNGFLFDCPRIFAAWGFEFRSSFVWVKPEMGIGNYWRNSHELLLTAVRGDAKRFNDHAMTSWMEEPTGEDDPADDILTDPAGLAWHKCSRGKHSSKPERIRQYIERASPGPYLELFGRSPIENWCVYGNQIRQDLFFQDVRQVA